jgi:hypothetical protein
MCVIKYTACTNPASQVVKDPIYFITLSFYTSPLSPETYHRIGRPHYSRCFECRQGRVPSHLLLYFYWVDSVSIITSRC